MNTTKIQWTDLTWNPTVGCSRVSPGCDHCYAERMSTRLQAMGHKAYAAGFAVRENLAALNQPERLRKGKRIFVNSMSDLFHPKVPFGYVAGVMQIIRDTPRHTYQVLTKRPGRMREFFENNPHFVLPNLWLGVSVEDRAHGCPRVYDLQCIPGVAVRFLSVEPLLEDVAGDLSFVGIHWVIVGGESGPGARPMEPQWVRRIRFRCQERGIPFFFKQWSKTKKQLGAPVLDGRVWQEFPKGAG